MIGHIDVSNSISHLIVTNDLDTCTITIDNPLEENEKIDLDVSLYKNTQIDIDVINGSPCINLTVYPEGTIRSSGSIFNYIDNNNIKNVEVATSNYLEKILKDYLYTITKKSNSDIVGFKGIYQSTFLTKEEFDKIHWDEIFKDSGLEMSAWESAVIKHRNLRKYLEIVPPDVFTGRWTSGRLDTSRGPEY